MSRKQKTFVRNLERWPLHIVRRRITPFDKLPVADARVYGRRVSAAHRGPLFVHLKSSGHPDRAILWPRKSDTKNSRDREKLTPRRSTQSEVPGSTDARCPRPSLLRGPKLKRSKCQAKSFRCDYFTISPTGMWPSPMPRKAQNPLADVNRGGKRHAASRSSGAHVRR
jgi:hypothetical protein